MVRGNRYKTIRWSFVESLEPPRVVQVRCPDMVSKGNFYGQVTVRMHTRQVSVTEPPYSGCDIRCAVSHSLMPSDMLLSLVDSSNLWPLWTSDVWRGGDTKGCPGVCCIWETPGQPIWSVEDAWQNCSGLGSTKRPHCQGTVFGAFCSNFFYPCALFTFLPLRN